MIEITAGTVRMSEQTLREILAAVEKAREDIDFTDEPMPKGDMSQDAFIHEKMRRGHLRIESPYSGITFVVEAGPRSHEQESVGYILREPEEPNL